MANNFPLDCRECHTTLAWEPASFDHNQTGFPLTGGHAIDDCQACHADGYNNTPNDCYACHQGDYQIAEPDHVRAGFPKDCELCHNTIDWGRAIFNHAFPIYRGSHRGEWDTCADCHVIPNNFAAFECINCHEHNKREMDDEHRGVRGYSYDSQACYSCHPNGEED